MNITKYDYITRFTCFIPSMRIPNICNLVVFDDLNSTRTKYGCRKPSIRNHVQDFGTRSHILTALIPGGSGAKLNSSMAVLCAGQILVVLTDNQHWYIYPFPK